MGFYNPLIPIINIIKKFLYFISKKIFILLLIIIFLVFFIILSFISESKAFTTGTGTYDTLPYTTSRGSFVVDGITFPPLPQIQNYTNFVLVSCPNNNTYILRCLDYTNHNTGGNYHEPLVLYESNLRKNFLRYGRTNDPTTVKCYEFKPNNPNYTDWVETTNFYSYLETFSTYGLSTNNTSENWLEVLKLSTIDFWDIPNNTTYFTANWDYDWEVLPYISNSTTSIENWSFDNLIIQGNVYIRHNNEFYKTLILKLVVNDYTFTQFIDTSYISYSNDNISNGNNWTITIPKNQLFNDLFNSEANLLDRNFILNVIDSSENEDIDYDLGTYDITLTQQQLNDINGQNNFNQQQQLQQDITNPNISSDFSNSSGGGFRDFSDGMEIQDNTSINSMFNMIYNAFTTQYGWNGSGQAPYELELTLPISNQTIKISPYSIYGRDWYTDNDNTAITIIKTLINMFWWYVIGSFVIKDIRNTINKVAEGNIENASSDIKKELL